MTELQEVSQTELSVWSLPNRDSMPVSFEVQAEDRDHTIIAQGNFVKERTYNSALGSRARKTAHEAQSGLHSEFQNTSAT